MSSSELEALGRRLDSQRERVAALEEQVRLICQITGVPCNLDASEVPADVRALV